MNIDTLTSHLVRPDVQQKILGSYEGHFSLGVGVHPEHDRELIIRVRIEGDDISAIATQVEIDGETIQVLAKTGFQLPTAQKE